MNEQLAQEIAALENQRTIFINDMERIKDDESQKGTYNALQAELDDTNKKLTAKQTQLSEVADQVQTAQAAVVEGLQQIDLGDGTTVSLLDFTVSPEAAEFLTAYISQKIGEVTAAATVQAQSYKQEIDALNERIDEVVAENYAFSIEKSDLLSKRDAAVAQIQEKDEEIARLNKDNQDLRDQMVKPAETNTTANLRELAEKAKAARPKIYNLHWKDESNRRYYIANLAENGDEIEFGYLFLGKYNVITEEEALQFRSETEPTEAAVVDENPVSNPPLDTGVTYHEPPNQPFQTEVPGAAVGGDSPVPAVVEEATSIEGRLAALERAVFGEIKVVA